MSEKPVFEVIKKRRQCYEFKEKNVPEDMLLHLLEAARWAPSCMNSQPWKFIIVEDKKTIQTLFNMCYYGAVKRLPPLIIVIVLDHKPATVIQASVEKHIVPYINHMSVSIPGYAICLAAHEVGLATCIKSPISKTVNALLGILDGDAVMFIGVGYASYVNSPPDRHPLASLVRRWEPTTNFVIKEG